MDDVRSSVVPDDRRVEPFDSLFEQRVFNRLVDRGYSVVPQFPAEGYRIDLVVVGAKARLAVECDGDAWHGPEAYERDLARQRDLERCGWRFFRIRESEFYADRPAVLARLWDALHELDIHPSGWAPEHEDQPATMPPRSVAVVEPAPDVPVAIVPGSSVSELDIAHPAAPEQVVFEPAVAEPVVLPESVVAIDLSEVVKQVVVDHEEVSPPTADSTLAAYRHFDGTVVHVGDASRQDLLGGLLRLVEAEGPVLGSRLHTAYVRASGAVRVTKLVAGELNKAISQAVRKGELIEDNPLGESGIKPRTYRLPDQPEVCMRQLGPRSLDEVPPAELAAMLDHVAERVGDVSEEALQRAVLELLGLKRLTDNVRSRFAAVQALRS